MVKKHDTPNLDQLEDGPWPSFVTGLKKLAEKKEMVADLLGQLEQSYQDRKGYWKGGTLTVRGYGGGIIPRFSELADKYPASSEFHTLRIMPSPAMHYTTDILRQLCDVWDEHGSGLLALHGQSGDMMFQGCTKEKVQDAFDAINELGFDLGGAGPSVRTSMSCVGASRCEHSCYNEAIAHRTVMNSFTDDLHRPALPYKFKFKFSGCPNDCMNSVQRADMAVIGTWRDEIQIKQDKVKEFINQHGRKYVIDNVVSRCPTRCISLNDDDSIDIDDANCVHCMHCINVMTKSLSPGKDRGVTILVGGKRTLKIGDLFGTVIVPFMKLESEDDYERLVDLSETIMDFWAENALEHERVGETIERIGLMNFLEGIGVDVDPAMVNHPRTNSFVRTDTWDEEAEKWRQRQSEMKS